MNRVAIKISTFYMLIGIVWVCGSDQLILLLSSSANIWHFTFLQSTKGIAFIFLSSAFLFMLVKNSHRRLKESEERYRTLFNEGPVPKLLLKEDTYEIIEANEAACLKYGFTKQEFHQQSIDALCPEPDSQFENWISLHESRHNELNLVEHKKKDGSCFYVQASSSPLQDNRSRLLFALDVHDKIEAEKKKNEALDQLSDFRSAVSAASILIITDHQGTILYVNDNFCRLSGYESSELTGKEYLLFTADLIKEDYFAQMVQAAQSSRRWRGEVCLQTKQNEAFWLDLTIIPQTKTEASNKQYIIIGYDITDKRAAQDELIKRERLFRSLVDSQIHYLIRIDSTGCYTFANNRFLEKTGFHQQELIGMHYQETVLPEDWEKCLEVEKLCEEKPGTIISIEIRKKNKDQSISWVNWEFIGVTNDEGEIYTIQGVGQDITDQKRTELEVQQAHEQYHMIAKATNDVAYDWNLQAGELNWTKSTLTSLKYSASEVERTIDWWKQRLHPEDKASTISDLYQTIEDCKESWDYEYRFLCGDNQYRYFYERGYILYNKKQEPVRMVGLMQDIQKQKTVQKEITKLSLVAEKTQNLVIITDKYGYIEWVNEGFTRQTGFSLEEVTGRKPGSFLQGPATDRETVKTIREKLQQKEKFTAELINYRKDGSSYWMRLFISPIFNEKSELVQYIAIGTDITERKQFITKLERQNTQLKEIAWISSHEIRRPVASILGLISLYDQEKPDLPFNQEIIRHLHTTTRELDQVIHQIVNKTYEIDELDTPYSEESA